MIFTKNFEMQSRLCQAMGHTVRLEIIYTLQDSPQHVRRLARSLGLCQANLSRHLAVLRNHGLVTVQHLGRENIHHLADSKIVVICGLMRQLLTEQLSRQVEIASIMVNQI